MKRAKKNKLGEEVTLDNLHQKRAENDFVSSLEGIKIEVGEISFLHTQIKSADKVLNQLSIKTCILFPHVTVGDVVSITQIYECQYSHEPLFFKREVYEGDYKLFYINTYGGHTMTVFDYIFIKVD